MQKKQLIPSRKTKRTNFFTEYTCFFNQQSIMRLKIILVIKTGHTYATAQACPAKTILPIKAFGKILFLRHFQKAFNCIIYSKINKAINKESAFKARMHFFNCFLFPLQALYFSFTDFFTGTRNNNSPIT